MAMQCAAMRSNKKEMTAVGFEPTPLRTGALSQRLRPLGQIVRYRYSASAIPLPFWLIFFCRVLLQIISPRWFCIPLRKARLAQSVERQPFKLVVVGSSPTVGVFGLVTSIGEYMTAVGFEPTPLRTSA